MLTTGGIMADLSTLDVPWSETSNIDSLDLGYYWHSASKFASPFLIDIANGDAPLNSDQRVQIANTVYKIFNEKWIRLWGIYTSEYNPIDNYNMTENETINNDVAISNNDSGTITNVIDMDTTNTGTQTNSGTSSDDSSIYGFNSSEDVPTDSSTGANSNTRTDNLASTEDTTNTETRNLSFNEIRNDDVIRSLTRQGNIGTVTSQKMINEEIDLWQWNFYKQVFEDIDSILALDIY